MASEGTESDSNAWPACILSGRTKLTLTSIHAFPKPGYPTFTKEPTSPDHVVGAVLGSPCWISVSGGRKEELPDGSVFWFLPGTRVEVSFREWEQPSLFWLQFNLYPRASPFPSRAGEPDPAIHVIESAGLCELVHRFSKIPFGKCDPDRLKALFYLIASEPATKSIARTSARDRLSSLEVRHLFDWLRAHMVPWPTPNDLARQVGLSPKYFSVKFKKTLNMTPRTWILRERMRTSAELLRETNRPIQEIAAQMGYDDAYRFSHQFRRVFATSPRSYREQQNAMPRSPAD